MSDPTATPAATPAAPPSSAPGSTPPAALTLDSAFDAAIVPEAHKSLFATRNIAKLGDLVTAYADAETRAAGQGKVAMSAKLDLNGLPADYQKIFAAKGIDTVQGMADWAVNGEKLIGSLGGKPMMAPEQGKLGEWMAKNADTLGVPKAAADYAWNKPKLGDGMEFDTDLEKEFRDFAHKRALPGEMFQDFADFGVKLVTGMQQKALAAVETQKQEAQAALKQQWGNSLPRNLEVAQFAARQMGLDGKVLDLMNAELGAPGLIDVMYKIGSQMAGANIITGDGTVVGSSAEKARAQLVAYESDANFTKALGDGTHPRHGWAVQEQERLMKIISGA